MIYVSQITSKMHRGEMAMNYFEKMLLNYLCSSKIKMEITGFDMDGFEKLLHQQLKRQLESIEYIVFSDDFTSDTERVQSIKELFQNCY